MNRELQATNKPDRRTAMHLGTLGGLAALGVTAMPLPTVQEPEKEEPVSGDRQAVLAAGMTEEEAICWEKAAATAGAFFSLPELHPNDRNEIAAAIHIVQNKLLSRPTYRKYLEFHKSNEAESEQSNSEGKNQEFEFKMLP